MDDSGKKRGILIPLIYLFFFFCVTTGGVLLVIYAFFPARSQPWHPAAAFALIGSTWIFWLLTYIYSWIKFCLRRDVTQNVTRQTTTKASAATPLEADGTPSDHPQDEKQDSAVAASAIPDTVPAYAA